MKAKHRQSPPEQVTVIEPVLRFSLGLASLWCSRELLSIFACRQISARYRQMLLGVLWAAMEPIGLLLLMTAVFCFLLKVDTKGYPYPVFAFSGMAAWLLFSRATLAVAGSLIDNIGLVSKVYFPRLILPIASVARELFDGLLMVAILLLLAFIYGFPPSPRMLALPLILICAAVLSLAIGLWFAAFLVKFRDIRPILTLALQAGMYVTPIVYSVNLVPERFRSLYDLNPMFWIVEFSRWALLGKTIVLSPALFWSGGFRCCCCLAGWWCLRCTKGCLSMSSKQGAAIKIEGLGKRYLMPRHDGSRRSGRLLAHMKKFLPFAGREEGDYFWALRDLDLEIGPGEILGILGRNGSGKSTLLKIPSGVTLPTTGRAVLHGKVASLLEVGAGFHPDMTGRENVFMSGALLGISQVEIRSKFDEIVDFSGIEKFIDVPAKRYSSGMYVRLTYAVASLLRSDILILDEVMAVGDAAFREKSQENIEKLASDGQTILYVSHKARSVAAICSTGMILDAGQCVFRGAAKDSVATYLRRIHCSDAYVSRDAATHDLMGAPRMTGGKHVLRRVSTHAPDGTLTNRFRTGQPLTVRIAYDGVMVPAPYFSVLIHNKFAERVATLHSTHQEDGPRIPETGVIDCRVDDLRPGEGTCRLMLDFGNYAGMRATMVSLDCVPNAASIHVELTGYLKGIGLDAYQGAAHPSAWRVKGADGKETA